MKSLILLDKCVGIDKSPHHQHPGRAHRMSSFSHVNAHTEVTQLIRQLCITELHPKKYDHFNVSFQQRRCFERRMKKKDVTWIWIRIPSKFIFISPQPLAFLGIIIAIKGCHMHISLPILLLREYINLYGAHSNRKAHKYSRIECRGDKSIDGKPIVAHRTPNRINISCSHSSANNIYACNNTKYKYNPNTTHSYAFHTSDK